MQFCVPHWDALRQALNERGLSGLVSKNGEEAQQKIAAQLEGDSTAASFDPLMNAHWAIVNNALSAGGLYLMGVDEDGDQFCPLCEVTKHYDHGGASDWLRMAADEQLQRARQLGLTSAVQ